MIEQPNERVRKELSSRQKKFVKKVMVGFACHAKEVARIFVLTESDEAISEGIDFVLTFQHLVQYLRRKYGKFEYCCILHRQGKMERLNYHIIYFGGYIAQDIIEDWWFKHYKSHRSKMEVIKKRMWAAGYLAGYMGEKEKFVSAHFSSNWVFPGWWSFGSWMRKQFFEYPPDGYYQKLAGMNRKELEHDVWYSIYRKELQKKGVIKNVNRKTKKMSLSDRVMQMKEFEILSVEFNK